ncbi:rhodanese-like domain-containing protein [Marinobacter arenosus]|uniref:rhodanese-like domain-containing protein n=1 Tax=Marinobacter arenosus TaxID=2856822 RepID=UPI001C4BB78E|nr:rhodanese-like domain-containing protein [Marinobacter arenosus]MBW0149239.1 rhodanese-like domain-containing protein [Marinobacter arenosus]
MYSYGRESHPRVLPIFAFPLVLFSSLLSAQGESAQCLAEADYMQMVNVDGKSVWAGEDFGCFVDVDGADTEAALVVDIRQAVEYSRVRIPGSVNLPPSKLLNNSALKDRPLIVVDEGFSRSTSARLCSAARDAGFQSFRILKGGLSSWYASGKSLIGLPGDRDQVFSISPDAFFSEAAHSRVSVVAPQSQKERLEQILPPNVAVQGVGQEESLERALVSLLSSNQQGFTVPVVLIGFDPPPIDVASQHRSVFLLNQSAHQIARAYQKSQTLARSRLKVPERYRCRG